MRRVAVRHDDELVREPALPVVQREVALVHEHGVHDDLLGNAQELLVERAHEHRGVLGEVHHLQKRLLGQLGTVARLGLRLRHACADALLARLLARHHEGALHHGEQVGGRCHLVRAGGQEAVAAREPAGREARELHGHHALVEQGHEPAHRAREELATGAPAARLRPGDAGDHALQHAGQKLRHVAGGHAALSEHVLGAVLLAALERFHVQALAAREADGGLRRVALGVERDLGGRAAEHLLERLGLVGHVLCQHDEAAGRGVHGHGPVRDAHGVERLGHELLQLARGLVQVERGNLLGAYLEGERMQASHGRPPPLPRRASCPPRAPCSSRTRPLPACAHAGCRPCAPWQISRRGRPAG